MNNLVTTLKASKNFLKGIKSLTTETEEPIDDHDTVLRKTKTVRENKNKASMAYIFMW